MNASTDRIRPLHGHLRQHLTTGVAVMTPGIATLGRDAVDRIIKTIAVFDDFCPANDPHGEHDFGSFDVDGNHISFKIDLYEEPDVKCKNEKPVVTRVLTICWLGSIEARNRCRPAITVGRLFQSAPHWPT